MFGRSAVSSHSLGRAWVHDLTHKLDAAEQHGHDLELFYEDVEEVAKGLGCPITPDKLTRAATIVRKLCDERGLKVICLQPFMHYEGLLDRQHHAQRIEEVKIWIELAQILGTNLIGIPSSFLPADQISGDLDLIVADLQKVADLGAPYGVTFSYEALCWGTHINTWELAYEVVQAVDRPNFGLCLDTFNMAGKIYADPEAPSGTVENADQAVEASLARLRTIDVKKVFCVQVVDAQRLDEPLTSAHPLYNASQPARMSWSRNCRLFYGEHELGAYLPIRKILHTIVHDLGFTGPISAEVFNACLTDPRPDMPNILAERAAVSWEKMVEDMRPTLKLSQTTSRSDSGVSLAQL